MQNIIIPPPLAPGDKVLIISPSGKIDKRLLKGLRERLESWGLDAILSKHASAKSGTFAGTIKQRLGDIQYGLNSKEIKAIFCSRGGYGAIQLIEHIDLTQFKLHPKWLVGYSDITNIHALLQSNGFASIHAPMARHFTVTPKEDLAIALLQKSLKLEPIHYTFRTHKYSIRKASEGVLIGGNLTVIQGLRSTPIDLIPKGAILYLEDTNESPNMIQRMFYNLKLSGILDQLSGLIIGQFTDSIENKNISEEVYKKIHPLLKKYHYPICYNFPIGHVTRNYPIINGAKASLSIDKHTTELKFG